MNIEISTVTITEFNLVRPHFEVNAEALTNQTQFVGEDGELVITPAKNWFWAGYDQSKFLKTIIDGETYIIGAGNIIASIITDVLPEACQKYPENFGTRNAHSVIEAIFKTRPELGYSDMIAYEAHLSTEQFAFVFKIEKDGVVNHNVLRLDLFRLIKEEKNNPGKFEFIGGLMHLLKHFKYQGFSLSTNNGENDLTHPNEVIGMIIKCFFESPHIYELGKKSFKTETSWPVDKKIICSFYPEQSIEVYFLNTMYIT